jgi:hypothetical protein
MGAAVFQTVTYAHREKGSSGGCRVASSCRRSSAVVARATRGRSEWFPVPEALYSRRLNCAGVSLRNTSAQVAFTQSSFSGTGASIWLRSNLHVGKATGCERLCASAFGRVRRRFGQRRSSRLPRGSGQVRASWNPAPRALQRRMRPHLSGRAARGQLRRCTPLSPRTSEAPAR